MKTGYIIQEIGYEYNDEYYYKGENGGGTPKMIFADESLAKKKMLELEIKRWKKQRIGDFLGEDGYYEIEDNKEVKKILDELGIKDLYNDPIPSSASDEQIKKLMKLLGLIFHEILEVDIDMSDDVEVNPSFEILEVQEELKNSKKPGIFDGIDKYMSGDINPAEIKYSDEEFSKEILKEVIKETEDDFLTIKQEMKKLRDEARIKVKNFFIKGMNKVFEMYPEVKCVSWTQYTPHCNDGEECVFGVYNDDFQVNGYSDYDDEGEEGTINVFDYNYKNGGVYKYHKGEEIKNTIGDFLGQLDEDDYRTMFGDHVKITARKDEIITEEYDHD